MDEFTLLVALAGLLFFLLLFVLAYVLFTRPKKATANANVPLTFEQLSSVINTDTTTNKALNDAVNEILSRFVTIDNYNNYEALLKKLCTHPHTDSKMVSLFEKTLREANPKFKDKLGKTLKEGLGKRDKK